VQSRTSASGLRRVRAFVTGVQTAAKDLGGQLARPGLLRRLDRIDMLLSRSSTLQRSEMLERY